MEGACESTVGGRRALVFQGKLDEADAIRVQKYNDLLWLGRSTYWLVLFQVCIALCGVVLLGPLPIMMVWLIFQASLLFILHFQRPWAARHHFRKYPELYPESRVILTDDRVAIENELVKSDFQWNLVSVVADTRHGLLFCDRERRTMFWLPARLFEDNYLREEVLDLVQRNGVPIRKLT